MTMWVGGLRASASVSAVPRARTYVPVQPVPRVGIEREPRSFGPLHGTPPTLTVQDLLAVRPRTRFAGIEARAAGAEGGTPSGSAETSSPAGGSVGSSTVGASKPAGAPPSEAEAEEVKELAARDREVRAHEQAHQAAAGRWAGAMTLQLERGPDGRLYAVGGEVAIDASPIEGDPEATIQKMRQVRRAALAPREPSAQDRRVAREAAVEERKARDALSQNESHVDRDTDRPPESSTPATASAA